LAWVLDLRRKIGIPDTLAELKVTADRSEEIGQMAERDPSAGGNPAPVDAAILTNIFHNAVVGKLR
jgi:alcohol dehydrogenase class IV